MTLSKTNAYTTDDIYALPEGSRAELIDGRLYMMAPPSPRHQDIIFSLSRKIADYIDKRNGDCQVYLAPYAVFLNADEKNYVEPDISVICDREKLNEKGCSGAPDWVIEVVSPSTERMDYGIKLFQYRTAGVREYWIINPASKTVNVYDLEYNEKTRQYGFDADISSCIFKDLNVQIH